MARVLGRVVAPITAAAFILAVAESAQARVKKIVVEKKVSPAFDGATFGAAGQYETLAGRAFGELDPNDPHNAIITDIRLAPRNANGKVEYIATFFLVKPIDMSKSSHLMWHDVPNRGGRITIVPAERNERRHRLEQRMAGRQLRRTAPRGRQRVRRRADREESGRLAGHRVWSMGRIFNARGPDSRPMFGSIESVSVQADDAGHDEGDADHARVRENPTAPSVRRRPFRARDWAWAKCSADEPVSRHAGPDADLPEERLRSKAAIPGGIHREGSVRAGDWLRRVPRHRHIFQERRTGRQRHAEPSGRRTCRGLSPGASRSRATSFARFIQLGFTQTEDNKKLYDGAWPIIAGRRISLNTAIRAARRHAAAVQPGNEGPQWWTPWPDTVARPCRPTGSSTGARPATRARSSWSISDSAEIWDLNFSPSFVGTSADKDIPLPSNVRRYYIPSTQHGGGRGGFSVNPDTGPGVSRQRLRRRRSLRPIRFPTGKPSTRFEFISGTG